MNEEHRMTVELVPWTTPNFITIAMPVRPREEGFSEAPKFALHEVTPEILSVQCAKFRAEVFKKAGFNDPQCVKGE